MTGHSTTRMALRGLAACRAHRVSRAASKAGGFRPGKRSHTRADGWRGAMDILETALKGFLCQSRWILITNPAVHRARVSSQRGITRKSALDERAEALARMYSLGAPLIEVHDGLG